MLKLFYSDPSKYAFAFQMYMLRACITSFTEATLRSESEPCVCILDRGVWGNVVFAAMQHDCGNINDEQWAAYRSVLKSSKPFK